MTASSMYSMLLVTACMLVMAWRERRSAIGALLLAIPVAGWLSIWLGK